MTSPPGALERELLAQVLAAPDDDAPRLAYARHLRDRGDPRGDYIHAQCVVERLDPAHDHDEWRRLNEQLGQLRGRYEREWTAELRELLGVTHQTNYFPARFHRGFVESLIVRADVLAATADRLFAAAPLLRSLHVSSPLQGTFDPALARAVGDRKELARVTSLRLFSCRLEDEACITFLGSPHLAGLRELDLGVNALGPASVARLLAAPFAANLTDLQLSSNCIGDDGAEHIAAAAPPSLRGLQLSTNGIGARGGHALAGSRRLTGVTTIDLCHNPLGDEAVCALVDSPSLGALRIFRLHEVGLTVAGISRVARIPGLARIEDLNLGGNEFGDPGLAALAGSPHTGGLVNLDLEGSKIGDAGMQALAQARALGRLTVLDLRYNRIGNVGAAALAGSTRLPSLIEVDLAYNDIDIEAPLIARFGEANIIGQGRRDHIR